MVFRDNSCCLTFLLSYFNLSFLQNIYFQRYSSLFQICFNIVLPCSVHEIMEEDKLCLALLFLESLSISFFLKQTRLLKVSASFSILSQIFPKFKFQSFSSLLQTFFYTDLKFWRCSMVYSCSNLENQTFLAVMLSKVIFSTRSRFENSTLLVAMLVQFLHRQCTKKVVGT